MSAEPIKLALIGASGRMGTAIVRLTTESTDFRIVGAVVAPDSSDVGRDVGELAGVGTIGVETTGDLHSGLLGADVAIDFSTASLAGDVFLHCERQGVAVVSGTTNLDTRSEAALTRAANKVPVLWAPNMSRGVQVLVEILEHALRRLGSEFDVEIVEVHHRKKIDAPSGTAVRLAKAAQAVRPELRELRGRDGQIGARTQDEVGVFGVRGGDVIGDHTIHLLGDSERLELTHRASNRDLFARGALSAARFVANKPPGRYSIADVLGA